MDASDSSVLRDLEIKTYLHCDHKKFWEICLDGHSLESVIRYGKLLPGDVEEPSSVQTSRKKHGSLGDGYEFVEQHINLKKEKGYRKLIKGAKESDDLSKYDPTPKRPFLSQPEPVSSLKRKNEESLMPENLKQVHKNEPEKSFDKTQFLEISRASLGKNGSNTNKSYGMEVENEIKATPGFQFTFSQDKNSSDSLTLTKQSSDAYQASFRGAYLTKQKGDKLHFCKVQVLKTYLKTETGFVGDSRSGSCQYRIYKTRKLAVDMAHDEIKEKINDNYRLNDELFTFDFTESEAGLKLGLMPRPVKSTPSSPTRALSDAPPAEKRPPPVKEPVKIQEIEYAKDLIDKAESELSFDAGLSDKELGSELSFDAKLSKKEKDKQDSELSFDAKLTKKGADKQDSELSFDLDDSKHTKFNRKEILPLAKPAFKRSESRVRSQSPEMKCLLDRDDMDESPLGKPVDGIYASLQLPLKLVNQNIDGWYYNEKIEGIRCFWDGSTLLSGRGRIYTAPDFFTKNFPESPLDGELWLGKGKATKLSSLLSRKKPRDDEWNGVKFVVHDAPELKLPFKKRLEKMKEVFKVPLSPYITLYRYKICKDKEDFKKIVDNIEKEGGEGLVLRDPQSFYDKGKSCSMLEVNTYHEDEAKVIGHEAGKGKHENSTGALRVKNEFGVEFTISMGLTDNLRKNPPKIGSKVRYRFRGVTEENAPKYATLIRNDD